MLSASSRQLTIRKGCTGTAILLLAFSVTLYIIAITLPELYIHKATTADHYPTTTAIHVGPFTTCFTVDSYNSSEHACGRWSSQCTARYRQQLSNDSVAEVASSSYGLAGWSCGRFNTVRVLLVLAATIAGIAVISASVSLLYHQQSRPLMWLTIGLVLLVVVLTAISGGLVESHLAYLNSDSSGTNDWAERGVTFWWIVAAVVLLVVAEAMYVWVWRQAQLPACELSQQLVTEQPQLGRVSSRYAVQLYWSRGEQILPDGT